MLNQNPRIGVDQAIRSHKDRTNIQIAVVWRVGNRIYLGLQRWIAGTSHSYAHNLKLIGVVLVKECDWYTHETCAIAWDRDREGTSIAS